MSTIHHRRPAACCMKLGLLTTLLSAQVMAQEPQSSADASPTLLEEVMVTASRREERLQDVAVAVAVLDPQSFANAGLTEITSVLPFVPGVAVQDTGSTYRNDVYIRGINATGAGGVGTYVDDIPYGSSTKDAGGGAPIDSTLLDLENLSVLKGPQGTLYGASAMGGVLKYKTRDPSTAAWRGEVSVDLSDTSGAGDLNQLYRLSTSGPLVADRLGVSVTGFWKDKAGYIDNVTIPKEGWDDYEYYGGSAALLFTPTDALSIKAQAMYQKSTQDGMATILASNQGVPRFGDFAIGAPTLTPSVFETKLFGLTINYDFGFAKLTSITSYQDLDNLRNSDLTTPYASFADRYFPANAPHTSAIFTGELGWERTTQELRLTSESNKSFEWIVGAFYSREEGYNTQVIDTVPAEPEFFWVDFPSKYIEMAAFATATYYFTPALDISAGYRLSDTENNIQLDAIGPLVGALPHNVFNDRVSTYLLNLRYRPTERTSVFARAANGFRPGVANFRIRDTTTGVFLSDAFVQPDKLWSYEVGIKGRTSDGGLNYELAAFYIDWQDFQVNVSRGGILVATNGNKASSFGAEASVNWSLTDSFSVMSSLAYTEAQLEADDPNVGGSKGEQLPNSPKWTATLGFNYDFEVASVPAFFSGSYRYNGEFPVGFNGVTIDGRAYSAASPRYINDSYDIVNLQLGVNTRRFEAALYVTNLFDEYAYTNITTSFSAGATAIPLRPRTVGVTLKTKFN